MDPNYYQIVKIILSVLSKKNGTMTNNPSIRRYINKLENRITFKSITEHCHKLLTPKTITLLRNTKNEIT